MTCIDPQTGFFVDCSEPGAEPIFSGGGVSGGGGVTVYGANTQVDVNVQTGVDVGLVNNVNVANQVLQSIQDSIEHAIAAGADSAANIASQTQQEITNALNQEIGGISNAANSLFGGVIDFIKSGISNLAANLGTIISKVIDNIGPILQDVATVTRQALDTIGNLVLQVSQQIQKINDTLIQPVTNVILGTINTISTLTQVIEKDLHEGLQGILSLPTDIANGLGSLAATVDRSVSQMHNNNKELVDVNFKTAAEDAIGAHIKSLGPTITSITGQDQRATTFKDNVKLPEPTISQAGAVSLQAVWSEFESFFKSLLSGGEATIDSLESLLLLVPLGIIGTVKGPLVILLAVFAAYKSLLPVLDFLEDDIRAKAGLEKLPVADALEAYIRKFIDADTLKAELSFNGFDAQRIKVLTDLKTKLLDTTQVLDMYFRGIINLDDLKSNLSQQGYIAPDQDALIEAATHVFDVSTATKAYQYGRLEKEQLTQVLKVHRFTANESDAYIASIARPERVSDLLGRLSRGFIEGRFLSGDPHYDTIPEQVQSSAFSEGLDSDIAADIWHAQFTLPPLHDWISLYFRGVRTRTELDAVFNYYRIPKDVQDDMIVARRSLIPWRTIPTMLGKGIISEAYAKQQLQAHGFDQQAVLALLNYAEAQQSALKTKASGDLHSSSVATARQLWDIGALSDIQYEDVLKAHGYDEAQARITIQSEKLQLHAKERRQVAQDITDEVLAGLITVDQANQQMSSNNFSEAEKARVLKSINRVQRTQTKTPGESELRKMVEKAVITLEDYKQALSVLGYSQKWVEAFAAMNFGSLNGTA